MESMSSSLDFELERVLPFVQGLMPGLARVDGMRSIGLKRNDELIAGVIYEGFNGHNMWMHVAAVPGGKWLIREYLKACFYYPFVFCGVDRVSGYVNANNAESTRFVPHLGFKEEARLTGAAPDGGDVIIYVMWKRDCRYVD